MLRKVVENTTHALYNFRPDDTYIRIEIAFPSMRMYLNPLVRYSGKQIPGNPITAAFAPLETFLCRVMITFTWTAGVIILYLSKFLKGYIANKRWYKKYEPTLA
jgi:hypothetical protein